MKANLTGWAFAIIVSATALISSCKKQDANATVEKVSDTSTIKKVYAWLNVQKEVSGDSSQIAKISRLSENLLQSAITIEQLNEKENLIIVPIKPSFKTVNTTSQPSLKNLVLIESESGQLRRGDIVEIIPKDQTLQSLPANLVSNVYNNKGNELNGIFSISSITNQFIYELKYTTGKLAATSYLDRKNDDIVNSNRSNKTESCINWYLVTTNYYSDGSQTESWQFLYSSCNECNSTRLIDSPIPFKVECGGGGGGGGTDSQTNFPQAVVTVDEVKKILTKPCFVNIVNSIGDANFKNQIVKLYNQTFVGTGQQANLKFIENSNIFNTDGSPRAAMSSIESGGTWVIQLNPNYGDAVSTEFWGSVIVHELVHSFIRIYQPRNLPMKEYEAHDLFFQKWVAQMSDFLVQSYNISQEDATSLAVGGLDDVLKEYVGEDAVFKQKYNAMAQRRFGISLNTAEDIRAQYKSGTKGKVCK